MDDSASITPSYNGVKTEQRCFTEATYGSSRIRLKRAHPRFSVFAEAEATLGDGTLVPAQVF